MERRTFLQLLSASVAGLPLLSGMGCTSVAPISEAATAPSTRKGWVSLFLASKDRKTSTLRLLNWDTYDFVDYPLPLSNPHSLVMDDRGTGTAYLFETFGSAIRIDLASRDSVFRDHTRGKDMFFGHATTSASGDVLFCTEMDPKSKVSSVVARSARDLSRLQIAPKEADGSHQVVALPNSKILACGNMVDAKDGTRGALTFLDSQNLNVVERVDLDFPIIHLVPLSSTEVVGLGMKMTNTKPGTFEYAKSSHENTPDLVATAKFEPTPLVYAKTDGTHRVFWDVSRKDLFQYNFGLARTPGENSFLTGHAASNAVFSWKGFEIAKSLEIERPMNIAVSDDGREFMVLSHETVKVFSMATFEEIRTLNDTGAVIALSGYKTSPQRPARNS